MDGYKDPAPAARAATWALYALIAFAVPGALLRLVQAATPPEDVPNLGELLTIPTFLALLACFVLVGRWIYRTNKNAHCLSADMTTSPGWAVGWFFIPLANLVMPYQAMKETWRESHEAAGQMADVDSPLLPWWWALWIGGNVVANVTVALGAAGPDALEAAAWVDLVSLALQTGAALLLIRIMKRLSRVQDLAVRATAFA